MTKILIVEDEKPAATRLSKLVKGLDTKIEIIGIVDSVEDAVFWFENEQQPDLAFFDIQLADGQSFQIFEQTNVACPVIFTTAFDQYAIKAFKVNSIDYLLKPIDPKELEQAWQKYQTTHRRNDQSITQLWTAFQQINEQKNFKERFLIKKGDQYKYLTIKEIAYFYSEEGLTFIMSNDGKRYVIDDKLDQLENTINPKLFFRINRKFIIGENAIQKISTYFNSRLILNVQPSFDGNIIVARERVGSFKEWLN